MLNLTHTHALTHARTHARTHTLSLARAHAHTHIHTHTHTHIFMSCCLRNAGTFLLRILFNLVLTTVNCIIVTIQYNTIQYNTIQYNTIQYNTIQYNTIQYNTIQYNTIKLYCPEPGNSFCSVRRHKNIKYTSDLQHSL